MQTRYLIKVYQGLRGTETKKVTEIHDLSYQQGKILKELFNELKIEHKVLMEED